MTTDQAPVLAGPAGLAPAGDEQERRARELVAGWLLERPSVNTRTAYAADLARLAAFLDGHGVPLLAATRPQVAAWAESMRRELRADGSRRISESTIARRLSVASSFFAYAVAEDAVRSNPVAQVRRPKRTEDADGTVWLDRDGMRAFLAAARQAGPRAHALAAVMLTTAARVSEVLAANVADLGATGGHRVLTVTRKGGKRQHLVIAPWVGQLLDVYLAGRTQGPLFATRARGGGHGRLDEPAVHRLVRRLAKQAGIEGAERMKPHGLRHSGITGWLDAGASIREAQAAAGHADPRTTERYDRARGRLDASPVYALAAQLAAD